MKNIVLIGFMGTGKSTMGRYLAKKLDTEFIDMDIAIEQEQGKSVPEIFKEFGEAHFRQLEREMVRKLSEREGIIIATGGGTAKNPYNVRDLKRNGVIFCLNASVDEILERTKKIGTRPVLDRFADRRQAIITLMSQRKSMYEQADFQIDTTKWDEEAIAQQILACVEGKPMPVNVKSVPHRIVKVDLGKDSYDIVIGNGVKQQILDFVAKAKFSKKGLIISDSNVAPLYADYIKQLIEAAGVSVDVAVVPAGESSKALLSTEALFTKCIEFGLDRKSPIFALGGGVVGDLTGFIAASYMRGVPFIQIPTSLLAQVDSSVGGKVAVNHPLGKNLIGAFYQPKAVFMDLNMLETLPRREIYTGLGEIIKYGIIYDSEFFEFLEDNTEEVLKLDNDVAAKMIARSCEIKAEVVSQDEKEAGLRAILNFGHTMGHAIEKNTNYTKYNHGEAVAIGMVCAARISVAMNMITTATADRIERLIRHMHLPTRAEDCDIETLYEAIFHDKKTVNGQVKWVLVDGEIGRVRTVKGVSEAIVRQAMQYCLK